jgi:hypothetical protein
MRLFWLTLALLGLMLSACDKSSHVDRQPYQGPVTTRIAHTAGGGTTASTNYQARISIGAPQPYGEAQGSGKVLKVGCKPSP